MVHREKIFFRKLVLRVPKGCFPPKYTFSTDLLASLLERYFSVKTARTALDLGCGTGALALTVARRGIYVIGVDISEKCVAFAARNARENKLDYLTDFVVCESGRCIRDVSVDVCFSNPPYLPVAPRDIADYSFAGGKHMEIFLEMFNGCRRVVKRRGCVLLAVNNLALKILKLEKFRESLCYKTPLDTIYILWSCD